MPRSPEIPTWCRPTWAGATVERHGRRRSPRGAGPPRVVWRVARALRRGLRGANGRGRDPPGPERRWQDHHAQVDHGHGAAAPGIHSLRGARAGHPALQPYRPARHRHLPRGTRHLREPERGRESPAAPHRPRRRAWRRVDLRALPASQGAPAQPGHQAVGRRAADARHRPHPAHGCALSPPRRADGGPGPGHRAADRRHDPAAQGPGVHDPPRGAEFPLRRHRGRPSLRDGARARGGRHRQCRARRPHGQAARIPWGIIRALPPSSGRLGHPTTDKGVRIMLKRIAIVLATVLALGPAAALAQISDGVIKIGVLNDQSSLYADLAGMGSVVAARMAVEDFGADKKGMKVEIVSADHQNKADVGSAIARQWYDVDKVDVIVDVPNSGVALAVNQITRDKGKALLVSGAATADLTGKACSPNTIHWTYDTWALANGTGNAIV